MQRERTYRQALRTFGIDISLTLLERAFHVTDKYFMREHPGIFSNPRSSYMPRFLEMLNQGLGIRVDVYDVDARWEAIKADTDSYWQPFSVVQPTLEALRREHFEVGIISNWDHTASRILNATGLSAYFDPVIISSEVGYTKPQPEIFQVALARAELDPEDCIYVGDNYYDDVLGSRRIGMPALLINRFGKLGVEEIDDCPIIQDISEVPTYLSKIEGK